MILPSASCWEIGAALLSEASVTVQKLRRWDSLELLFCDTRLPQKALPCEKGIRFSALVCIQLRGRRR